MPTLDDIRGLRFGPIGPCAVHVAIDMQRLFAEPTEWHAPSLAPLVAPIARIAQHRPQRTIFTRFLTPHSAEHARGQWRTYYRRWRSVTLERLAPDMLDLVAPLAALAPPTLVVDKHGHSSFSSSDFLPALGRLRADTLVLTGVETDVCVLTTALDAIDHGLRVILIEDAVASSSPEGHRACLDHIYPRYDQQIEVLTTDALIDAWRE